ncbi:SDR family NAD(P)-dependent oxidoreductase [Variovorax boronicumulans]|uniref:SDR family NAD(P)-dependent oxidoreductase n=1 Tax=Variovorax boronicumulans TaxID=436515 RepID=UPI001C589ED2
MAESDNIDHAWADDFRGKVAVVTGGGSGIGMQCALDLAAAGATVVAADLRFGPAYASEARTHALHRMRCDVAAEASVQALFAQVLAEHGRVDILVNSAGVVEPIRKTIEQEAGEWERIMDINAKGVFLCCREAGRAMVAQRSGAIVNIGSVAGLVGIPASNAYGPSKAAVAHMTRSMACEWARLGIRVNCVAPGYVDAPMAHELFDKNDEAFSAALKRVPLGRLAQTREMANVVLFLCSSLSSYVTGAVMPVDGGWSAFGGPSR